MTVQVDPFTIPIPRSFLSDPEIRGWAEYLTKFLHDLWKRSGGSVDAIATVEETITIVNSTVSRRGGVRQDDFDNLTFEVQNLAGRLNSKVSQNELNQLNDRLDYIERKIRHNNHINKDEDSILNNQRIPPNLISDISQLKEQLNYISTIVSSFNSKVSNLEKEVSNLEAQLFIGV